MALLATLAAGAHAMYECCAGGDNGCAGHLQIGGGDCDSDSDCAGDNYCGDGSWSLGGDDYVNGTCTLRKRSKKSLVDTG